MAFTLKIDPSYTWPVPLIIPADGGRKEKHTFDAEFRRLPQSRINEIIKMARDQELGRGDDETLDDKTAAREILIGWTGVMDDSGKEMPFSEAALEQLLEYPTIAGQIITAWFDSMKVAKKGN